MTYKEHLLKLSARTERQVVDVFELYLDAEITTDEAIALVAAIIAKANSRAIALADVSIAASLMRDLQRPVATLGLGPDPREPERLSLAAATLLAVGGLSVERAARLGRSEPLEAAAKAYSQGISQQPGVVGWTRLASPDACEACQSMTGPVLDPETPMWHHTGCSCTQQLITRKESRA